MKRAFGIVFALACKPHYTIDPVYDCTVLMPGEEIKMKTDFDACQGVWSCEQGVMKAYCQERKP